MPVWEEDRHGTGQARLTEGEMRLVTMPTGAWGAIRILYGGNWGFDLLSRDALIP